MLNVSQRKGLMQSKVTDTILEKPSMYVKMDNYLHEIHFQECLSILAAVRFSIENESTGQNCFVNLKATIGNKLPESCLCMMANYLLRYFYHNYKSIEITWQIYR